MYIPETAEKQMSRQCVSAFLTEHVYNKTYIDKSYALEFFAPIYQFTMFSQTRFLLTDVPHFCQQWPQKMLSEILVMQMDNT